MKTILVVEAVASQRQLLVQWLKDDYTVLTAADGAGGLALAERTDPDLIFVALTLPGSADGEGIQRLKVQARRRDTPVIALTAQAGPDAAAQARAAGYADAIRLPLEEEQVYATLGKWLGGG